MSAAMVLVLGLIAFVSWRQLVALVLAGVVILLVAGVASVLGPLTDAHRDLLGDVSVDHAARVE